MTHCGLPDFLFVFVPVFPSLCSGKPLNRQQNRCLSLNGTPAAAQKEMQSTFSKTEMSKTSFVPARRSDTTNKRFRISPAAQKQMNWQVNCALRENYSS